MNRRKVAARGLLLLPPIRAAEYGSFKKLESRHHAIIFHALRCLRNDIESFLVLITKNSPDHPCVCVCKSYRSRFVYLVIYTVQSHSCILWGGAIMVQCIRHRPIITNRFRRTPGCCSHSILTYLCMYVLMCSYRCISKCNAAFGTLSTSKRFYWQDSGKNL